VFHHYISSFHKLIQKNLPHNTKKRMTVYSDCIHTINTKTQEIQHTEVPLPTVQTPPAAIQVVMGAAVGFAVGLADGPAVGFAEGWAVGLAVGEAVGSTLGIAVGDIVGLAVGPAFRFAEGWAVGFAVDSALGIAIGDTVHFFPLQGLTFTGLGALVALVPPPLSTRTAET
jgi:hypothetical protein